MGGKRKKCIEDGCQKFERNAKDHRCLAHKGGTPCSIWDCTNARVSVSKGTCAWHGGGPKCIAGFGGENPCGCAVVKNRRHCRMHLEDSPNQEVRAL